MARFFSASRRGFPARQFEGEKSHLFTHRGIPQFHLLAHPVDGSIKPHAGLSADNHQVKGVRKAPDDLVLPVGSLSSTRGQGCKTR